MRHIENIPNKKTQHFLLLWLLMMIVVVYSWFLLLTVDSWSLTVVVVPFSPLFFWQPQQKHPNIYKQKPWFCFSFRLVALRQYGNICFRTDFQGLQGFPQRQWLRHQQGGTFPQPAKRFELVKGFIGLQIAQNKWENIKFWQDETILCTIL